MHIYIYTHHVYIYLYIGAIYYIYTIGRFECVLSEMAPMIKDFNRMCNVWFQSTSVNPEPCGHRELRTTQSRTAKFLNDLFFMPFQREKYSPPKLQYWAISQVYLGMNRWWVWIIEWMCERVIKKWNWSEPWSRLLCFVLPTHQVFL